MKLSKPVKIIGGLLAILVGGSIYMFLNQIRPSDFFRTPEGVLDDAIYAAQQHDLKEFQRTFTKDMRQKIDKMNDSNINREMGVTSDNERADLFWTWDTLMERMAKQGGFEVKPTSTKFLDYMIEGEAKLEIVYFDKEQGKEKQKNYKLHRNDLVWHIDISADPDFVKAYSQSVRGFRPDSGKDDY